MVTFILARPVRKADQESQWPLAHRMILLQSSYLITIEGQTNC